MTKEFVYFKRETEFRLEISQTDKLLKFVFKCLNSKSEGLVSLTVDDYINTCSIGSQFSSYLRMFKTENMIDLFVMMMDCVHEVQAACSYQDVNKIWITSVFRKDLCNNSRATVIECLDQTNY